MTPNTSTQATSVRCVCFSGVPCSAWPVLSGLRTPIGTSNSRRPWASPGLPGLTSCVMCGEQPHSSPPPQSFVHASSSEAARAGDEYAATLPPQNTRFPPCRVRRPREKLHRIHPSCTPSTSGSISDCFCTPSNRSMQRHRYQILVCLYSRPGMSSSPSRRRQRLPPLFVVVKSPRPTDFPILAVKSGSLDDQPSANNKIKSARETSPASTTLKAVSAGATGRRYERRQI